MQSWEESVKFSFGNKNEDDEFLVSVPGIQDDEDSNINESYHTMERYIFLYKVLIRRFVELLWLANLNRWGASQFGSPGHIRSVRGKNYQSCGATGYQRATKGRIRCGKSPQPLPTRGSHLSAAAQTV